MAGGFFSPIGNGRYAGGTRREEACATFKVKTTTGLKAGVYVIKDTTDAEIQLAGAGAANVIGVLIRNLSNPAWDPTTAPAAGDHVEVALVDSGAWVWVRNGANLAAGAVIATDASGQAAAAVTAAAGDYQKKVGRTLIDNDGSGTVSDVLVVL